MPSRCSALMDGLTSMNKHFCSVHRNLRKCFDNYRTNTRRGYMKTQRFHQAQYGLAAALRRVGLLSTYSRPVCMTSNASL